MLLPVIWYLMMAIHKVTRSDTLLISSYDRRQLPVPVRDVSMSWQNDQTRRARLQSQGVKSVYIMAAELCWKRHACGLQASLQGEIVAAVYTKLGQTDFQAELSTLAMNNIYLPARRYGDQFCQAVETGWHGSVSKLYTVFTRRRVAPGFEGYALGVISTNLVAGSGP